MKKLTLLLTSIILTSVFLFSSCTNDVTSVTEEEMSEDAYMFVEKLSQNKYSEAKKEHSFDTIMNLLTGKKTLQTIWESLESDYGEYVNIYGYEYKESGGFDNIYIKIAFQKQCVNFQVTYKKGTLKISGLHYAVNADKPTLAGAEPTPLPDGIIERSFEFGQEGLELPAILTLPETDGKYPVVILVHGSGPNNADESIGNQAPFRDIAWGLAQQGIAVMRYDKRTLVYPESFGEDATVEEETVIDALLAVEAVMDMPEIDSSRIYILGHSLGGMMMPLIAEDADNAHGFIMMGAPVTPMHELILEQTEYIYNLDGKLAIRERLSIWQTKNTVNKIAELTDDTKHEAKDLFNISPTYWIYLNDYNMLEEVNLIEKPLLIIQGESDYQVPMRDFYALNEVLGDKDNVTMISYDGLGHLMTEAGDPPSPDDYMIASTVAEDVIDDIASFVLGG